MRTFASYGRGGPRIGYVVPGREVAAVLQFIDWCRRPVPLVVELEPESSDAHWLRCETFRSRAR